MSKLDDQTREKFVSNDGILGDWNLSETWDHVPAEEELQLRNPQFSKNSRRLEARKHRIDREASQRGPHQASDARRHSDTALFGAFDLKSQTSAMASLDSPTRGASGMGSDVDGMNPRRSNSSPALPSDDGQSRPRLPKPGDSLGGFRIILELGRGAFARVYLAEETNLASRLVAIKVSKSEGDEPQILARLQHTHIVPVHSVHTDPSSGLRILCMPYFGGANLAEVLESAVGLSDSVADRTGHSLIQALDRVSRQPNHGSGSPPHHARGSSGPEMSSPNDPGNPVTLRPRHEISFAIPQGKASMNPLRAIMGRFACGMLRRRAESQGDQIGQRNRDLEAELPSRRFLRGASGIQASVWIVARLAEGLEHAHARGLLHRDLKPSNVLIAADGTPMLLDFNLSVEQAQDNAEETLTHAKIGGTLPYMSPEHLDAFNPRGSTDPRDVDRRSDIYALGLILFEMIAGQHPFPEPSQNLSILETIKAMVSMRRQVPSLRSARADVPWSLDALTAKCLDPDPDRRYASANDLAEDLRRFLDNRPMKHCPEPSLKERFGKWARRHPAISSSTSVGLICLALVLTLGVSTRILYNRIQDVAARLRLQVFRQRFTDSQFWLNTQSDRIEHMKKGLLRSEQTLQDVGLSESARGAGTGWIGRLGQEEREQVYEQAVELSLLDARASVKVAEKLGNEGDRRRALERAVRLIDRAQRFNPRPTSALFAERARFQEALGHAELAELDRRRAAEIPLSSSYDYLILGISLLADGQTIAAETPLKEAMRRDVTSFWAWFGLGHCYFNQGRFSDAVAAFTASVVRGPKFAWAHFNLGLALAKSGRLIDAKAAYDRAIELDPDLAEAFINRGLVELELNQLDDARADLERGIAAGRDDSGIQAALGETLARLGLHDEADRFFREMLEKNPENPNALVARGMVRLNTDPRGAKDDFSAALGLDPNHAPAHYGLARILRPEDPMGALAHLDSALKSDPNLLDAVQLRALIRARLADPAVTDDVDRLLEKPTPHRLYNAACALAVYAEKSKTNRGIRRSLDLLMRAVNLGFPVREAESDPDLVVLRTSPEFQRLITDGRSR